MKVGSDFFIYRLAYKSTQVHQFSIYKLFPWGQSMFFFFFLFYYFWWVFFCVKVVPGTILQFQLVEISEEY